MSLLEIAFLKNVSAPVITLVASLPAIAFSIYVFWDDHRQAKAHQSHDAHGGDHGAKPH